MSEPIKILPMAQLLRLAKEKDAREQKERSQAQQDESQPALPVERSITALSDKQEQLNEATVPIVNTVPIPNTVPTTGTVPIASTVPKNTTVPKKQSALYRSNTVVDSGTVPKSGIVTDQFTQVPNGVLDSVLPRLKPTEQVVMMRLYRLSRGFNSDVCRVGFNTLAKSCNISKSTAQVTIARLLEQRLIEVVGIEQGGTNKQDRGTIYRVNLPAATVPIRSTVPKPTTVPTATTNKHSVLLNTHTNTEEPSAVGGCSRFSAEECRRYATHLNKTGQGITNPGGYATKIHRTGEADELIAAFLNPTVLTKGVDASQCPDCHGTGYYYPRGTEHGVARCKHERLREGVAEKSTDA